MQTVEEQVAAILSEAGFTPMPAGEMRGLMVKACAGGWWMGGVHASGVHSKHTGISAETADDPIEAAHELATLALRLALPLKAMETGDHEQPDHDHGSEPPADDPGAGSADEGVSGAQEQGSGGRIAEGLGGDEEPAAESEPLDAEFDDYGDGADPLLTYTEGDADDATAQEPDGPVAYFSDDIRTIQLAKLGRLGQIARERKAALQEGWTVEEFASLQNLIMRIDRGEAPDDPEARARFLAISERSRAMNAVDAFKGQREAELEAADRDGVMAFDPEAGWGA